MSYDKTSTLIKHHEGYRDEIYKDSLGNLTVGWGCHLYPGKIFSKGINERLFFADYYGALQDYGALNLDLDPVRKTVVVDMIFNMGISTFKEFRNFISSLRDQDYQTAAHDMMHSLWAEQVGSRSKTLEAMMRTGEWPEWIK